MANSTNLILPLLAAAQAQKHVTVNEGLQKLDALVQLAPKSDSVSAEPGSPADGDVYILPAGKTGTNWGPAANYSIAHYRDGVWQFYTPREGFLAWLKDTDVIKFFNGTTWQQFSGITTDIANVCDGRLTLTSAIPVQAVDVTAVTTLYFTPCKGNQIGFYDGVSAWSLVSFTEKTIKLTDAQTGTRASTSNGIITGLTDTSQLIVGMEASGTGIGVSAVINSIDSATQVTLSVNNTGTGTSSVTFKVPADTNLDIFAFNNSGAVKLEMVKWSNSAIGTQARTISLATQDGVYVKSGVPTRRFLGMVRTTATSGQTEFSMRPAAAAGGSHPKLYVWNLYNRVPVAAVCRDSTDTWTYTTGTIRPSNNSSNNRVSFVSGLAEGRFHTHHSMRAENTSADIYRLCAIGYDSTNTIADGCLTGQSGSSSAGRPPDMSSVLARACEAGFHYVQELEYSSPAGTTTWYGDGGAPTLVQTGMMFTMEM